MDEIQALEHLRAKPLSELKSVAKATKIPWPTLVKVKYGTTKYPRLPHLKKIVVWAERDKDKKAA